LALTGLGLFFALGVKGLGMSDTGQYLSTIGLPDEYYRLTGIIAAEWEYTEYVLEWAIREISLLKGVRVDILIVNIPYQAKYDLVMAFARQLKEPDPKGWERFKKALKDIKEAYTLRNTYVHARWLPHKPRHPGVKRSVTRSRGGRFVMDNIPVSEDDLVAAAVSIQDARESFMKLMQSYNLMLPKKRKASRSKRP